MKKAKQRILKFLLVLVMFASAGIIAGCGSTEQIEQPRDFIISDAPYSIFHWSADSRSPYCRVYLWNEYGKVFEFKSIYVRETSDPLPVFIQDLNLEIGENLIRIISIAPRNRRNLIDSEPVYLTLLMDESGQVIII
ncbi:MAG: hypothetical protein FWB72_05750 [Firmicutes bacterium]|nr:hypothetical protein [Bacillota bacterium]